jgi:hypothetical protein
MYRDVVPNDPIPERGAARLLVRAESQTTRGLLCSVKHSP